MAIPSVNHPCWLKLARGQLERLPTEHLSMQLLRKRLSASEAPEQEKAADIRRFFEEYERILVAELAMISRL